MAGDETKRSPDEVKQLIDIELDESLKGLCVLIKELEELFPVQREDLPGELSCREMVEEVELRR